ncbi:MAG: hypothetical protein ACRD59_00035 [Candidatus Acidiferrales bacterium]
MRQQVLALSLVLSFAAFPCLAQVQYHSKLDPRVSGDQADDRKVGDWSVKEYMDKVVGSNAYQNNDFPPGNSDARFGVGFDSLFAITKQPCVVYSGNPNELASVGGTGQSATLKLTHATTSQEFAQSLKVGGSASFGFGVYSGNLAVDYFQSQRYSRFAEFLTEDLHVENQAQFLKQAVLTLEAKKAAAKGFAAFQSLCGDQYIAGLVTGGDFTAVLEATSDSEQEQQQMSASFSASAWGNTVSGSVAQQMQSWKDSGRLSISIVRKGTFEPLPSFDVQALQDYIRGFPPKVVPEPAGHPWAVLVVTKSYDGLVSFAITDTQRRALEQMSQYLADVLKRRAGLAYIAAHEDLFGGVDEAKLTAELGILQKTILNLTSDAKDCAGSAAKCKTTTYPDVAELPQRVLWQPVDPKSSARLFVGTVPKNAKRIVEVRGFWSPYDRNPGPGVQEWLGPGQAEAIFFHSNDTGQDSSATPTMPLPVPSNSLVYFFIGDSYYGDNRTYPPDPVRVALYQPVY